MGHVRPMIAEYAILTRDERVLLIRLDDPTRGLRGWHLPGGRLEEGERSVEGLCREIEEETAFVVRADDLRVVRTVFIDPERLKYAAVFVGEAPEGDVVIEGTLNRYAWMDRDEAASADFAFRELKDVVLEALD